MERCYFCHGKVTAKKIEHLHRWGDTLLLVKGLPPHFASSTSSRQSAKLLPISFKSRFIPSRKLAR